MRQQNILKLENTAKEYEKLKNKYEEIKKYLKDNQPKAPKEISYEKLNLKRRELEQLEININFLANYLK